MIKALGMHNGKPLLVLGLSRLNTERLLAGQPIPIDTAEVGIPGFSILLVAGETEDVIVAELATVWKIDQVVDTRSPQQRQPS